jgi:hypothetical protein
MTAQATAGLGMSREPGERWTRFARRVANAFGLVVLLVLLTYVLASLLSYKEWTALLITISSVASVTVALTSAEARHWVVRWGLRLDVLAVLLAFLNALLDAPSLLGLASLIQMLLFLCAAAAVLRAVVTESEVGFRTILGAISVYLMFGLLFTFLYAAIDRLQPGLFFGEPANAGDYVFFSFTTLTTTGYGNLVPAGQPGEMFAGLEMLLGQIFLVTLIAGLVSLWRPGQVARLRRDKAAASESEAAAEPRPAD